jgi:2-polyprenyl-3-methyl-5-hydroxy-6-metoxy-1,4-benzoquinol methylase/spore coat polysaccharide biosynthesis predicted glycosyltransferase SpsG
MNLPANLKWVFIPETAKGQGTGHMFRCLRIAQEFLTKQVNDFIIVLPSIHPIANLFPELKNNYFEPDEFMQLITTNSEAFMACTFVLDKPYLTKQSVQRFIQIGKVMALDGGGEGRGIVPYLVDTLPNLYSDSSISSPWLLDLPEQLRHKGLTGNPKVLIAMGGEDKAGLTFQLLQSKPLIKWLQGSQVTVLQGPGMDPHQLQSENRPHWQILPSMPNLRDHLYRYDLVITIFGLTAYEAMASGTPVALVHPTEYHNRLANHAELDHLFRIMKTTTNLQSAFPQLNKTLQTFLDTRPVHNTYPSLSQLIIDYHQAPGRYCPCCSYTDGIMLYRFPDRSFIQCSSCSTEYQILTKHHGIKYSSEYFFEDYKKQYGKDYLEDFDHIKAQGLRRLKVIQSITQKTQKNLRNVTTNQSNRLLDIGCAFGPFLQASAEMGYHVHGIDVSEEGVRYINDQLRLSAEVVDVFTLSLDQEPFKQGFDVISLWYVIEHFECVNQLLPLIFKMLNPGGILAIGTPSSQGISRRRNPKGFFLASPKDHFSLWNPRQAKKVLTKQGFIIRNILCPTFHSYRYPTILQKSWLLPVTKCIHHWFLLGDTMEIYCQKPEAKIGAK